MFIFDEQVVGCQVANYTGSKQRFQKLWIYSRGTLASYLDRYLSPEQEIFTEDIHTDLKHFITQGTDKCVLIFPPFNSYYRFLAHKCTEEYTELKSFSIGQSGSRRLVVCNQSDYISKPTDSFGCMSNPRPPLGRGRARGRTRQDGSSPGVSPVGLREDLYVPIPDGKSGQTGGDVKLSKRTQTRTRKPEVQLYVPRGRRLQGPKDEDQIQMDYTSETTQSDSNTDQVDSVSEATLTSVEHDLCASDDYRKLSYKPIEYLNEKSSSNRTKRSKQSQVYIPPGRRKEVEQTECKQQTQRDLTECKSNSHEVNFPSQAENIQTHKKNTSECDPRSPSLSSEDVSNFSPEESLVFFPALVDNSLSSKGIQDQSEEPHLIPGTDHDQSIVQCEISGQSVDNNQFSSLCSGVHIEKKDLNQLSDIEKEISANLLSVTSGDCKEKDQEMDIDSPSHTEREQNLNEEIESVICTGESIEKQTNVESIDLNEETDISTNSVIDSADQHSSKHSGQEYVDKLAFPLEENNGKIDLADSNGKQDHMLKHRVHDSNIVNASSPLLKRDKDSSDYTVNNSLQCLSDTIKQKDAIVCVSDSNERKNAVVCVSDTNEQKDAVVYDSDSQKNSVECLSGSIELKDSVLCVPDSKEQQNSSKDIEQTNENSKRNIKVARYDEVTTDSQKVGKDVSSTKENSVKKTGKSSKKTKNNAKPRSCNDEAAMEIISVVKIKDTDLHHSSKTEVDNTDEKGKKKGVKKKLVKVKKTKKSETTVTEKQDDTVNTTDAHVITKDNNGKTSDHSEEEDSWDKMFDDDGECLDPNAMEELTEAVGKVKIKKPVINYLDYQPKEPEMDYEGMNHVIEIYDFSPELKTEDLLSAFSQFKSKGFDIKWVDDTHALGVFSSEIAATDALQSTHPLLKVGPLSQACRQSKLKAKRAVEFLQPYKRRPETTAVVARRMLTGALGLKTKASKEQREKEIEEKQKLKQAKEKKKKEKQLKEDIWEGNYSSNVQSDT